MLQIQPMLKAWELCEQFCKQQQENLEFGLFADDRCSNDQKTLVNGSN